MGAGELMDFLADGLHLRAYDDDDADERSHKRPGVELNVPLGMCVYVSRRTARLSFHRPPTDPFRGFGCGCDCVMRAALYASFFLE